MQKKKLQVFISSTFEDMKIERQAAVNAVLNCGHIPAGMELFSAGDESQMEVIKRWIEESDVYLLILGGRYGTVEEKSGKSYIHLEYEYALELQKPLFAVVIDENHLEEKNKEHGSKMLERKHPQKLEDFKKLVLSKLVRFFSDVKDIRLAIHETLSDFERRDELIGWIRGDQGVKSNEIIDEMARLSKENDELRGRFKNSNNSFVIGGLNYEEMLSLLKQFEIYDQDEYEFIDEPVKRDMEDIKLIVEDSNLNLLHYFIANLPSMSKNRFIWHGIPSFVQFLLDYELIERKASGITNFRLTKNGIMLRNKIYVHFPEIHKMYY